MKYVYFAMIVVALIVTLRVIGELHEAIQMLIAIICACVALFVRKA